MDFKGFYDHIIFDIDRPILQAYQGKQGDTKSRGAYVTVTQNNVAVGDLSSLSMRLFYVKPDGTRGFIDAVSEGDRFRVDYTNQMLAVVGVVKAELRLSGDNGAHITDKTYQLRVSESLADGSIISENERGILDQAFELAEDILPRIELLDVDMLENYQGVVEQNKVTISSVKKELNDLQSTLSQVNINQEAKQSVTGYDVLSLPPNAVNGQVGVAVKGLTITQELDYNPKTLEEWALLDDTTVIDGKLKMIRTTQGMQARLSDTKFKPNTKYGMLLYYHEGDQSIQTQNTLAFPPNIFIARPDNVGHQKSVLTTLPEISSNRLELKLNNTGFATISNLRAFELPENSTIENDFETMSADELAAKYPFVRGAQSTLGAMRLKSVGKNLFDYQAKPFHNTQAGSVTVSHINNGLKIQCQAGNPVTQMVSYPYELLPDTMYAISVDMKSISGSSRVSVRNSSGAQIKALSDTGKDAFKTDGTGSGFIYFYAKFNSEEQGNNEYTNIQIEEGTITTPYEPYTESTQYITAVNDNKIVTLKSLPNGVRDEIRDGKMIKGVSDERILTGNDNWSYWDSFDDIYRFRIVGEFADAVMVSDNSAIGYSDVQTWVSARFSSDQFETLNFAEGALRLGIFKSKVDTMDGSTSLEKFKHYMNEHPITLTYQLAEPEIIPIEVSGTLVSNPSGTIYIDHATYAVGIYSSNGITVTEPELPIKALNKITKIDYATGVEHELDVSESVISEDKLLFTHADLTDGDIVFFDYDYDVESTNSEVTIEYYDSRYVIQDSVTDKFYKWDITVADGVPSINLVEV